MKSIREYMTKHGRAKHLVIDGLVVGAFSGSCSILYRYLIQKIGEFRDAFFLNITPVYLVLWFLFLIAAGLVVHLLLQYEPLSSGSGIPQLQGELLGLFDSDPKKIIFAKFTGGSLAGMAGMSLGREGPSIQIGAAAAKLWAKLRNRSSSETDFLMSAGASAGLSAAFNAPISGVIFVLEELHKAYSGLFIVPALVAAIAADFISKRIFGLLPAFQLAVAELVNLRQYYHLFLLAVFCAGIGILFNTLLLKSQQLYAVLPIPRPVTLCLAFVITGLVGIGAMELTGGGHGLIESLLHQRRAISVLLLLLFGKLLFTCFCYGSSTQGGIFLPVLALGALVGTIYFRGAQSFGLLSDPLLPNFIILGMAGILAAVIRSPLLSILLVTEMTGSFSHLLSISTVSIASFLIANELGSEPIYDSLLHRLIQGRTPQISEDSEQSKTMYHVTLSTASRLTGSKIMDLSIPKGLLILTILRQGKEIIPRGDTFLLPGDTLFIATTRNQLRTCASFFNDNFEEPMESTNSGCQ